VITSGDESTYASVLRSKPIRESGILNEFLFVEAGLESPVVPALMNPEGPLERWQQMITQRFEARIAAQKAERRIHLLDNRGLHAYVEMRKWIQIEKSFARLEVAPFLSSLADLCLKLALIRTAMGDAPECLTIPGEAVEHCAEFVRVLGRRQRELLERLVTAQPDEELIEQEVGQLVHKLERSGPLTKRGLARRYHHQDYARLEPLLEHGLRHGNIRQHGNLFSVPNVSVNVSA
jgi:hypothetical protein